MKSKKVADIAFIVACVALVGLLIKNRFYPDIKPSEARENLVPANTSLQVHGQAKWHVVVVVSPNCRFCEESMPLYARLRDGAGKQFDLTFESPVLEKDLHEYLDKHGLASLPIRQAPPPPGVTGTPTLIVADTFGRVVASLAGRLSSRQESALFRLLQS